MCQIPVDISDDEKIVRAIMCPYHLNKDRAKLIPRAFRSRPGSDEVSVIRHTHTSSDFCKRKARETASRSGREYAGLAVLSARQIRKAGSEVHDSRDEYCGHAHISHGIIAPPPNEPLPPRDNMELDRKVKELRNAAVYYPDPEPHAETWTGPTI